MSEKFTPIPIELLVFSGRNPRTEMRGLEELAENIEQYGVLQPIIVRPKEDKYEIVVGERRVRASIMAGLKKVPTMIRTLTDRQTDELRLIENIHREDLTDAEKGDAVLALLDHYPDKYPTIKSISEKLTKPYKSVWEWTFKSRKLSEFVKKSVVRTTLDESDARRLLKYSHSKQNKLAEKIMEHQLSKRQVVEFLKLYDQKPDSNLDKLANEVKGIEILEVPMHKLPERIRKEVIQVIEEERKERSIVHTKEEREKISKAHKEMAKRKREARKRLEKRKRAETKQKPIVSEVPLLLEEREDSHEVPEHVERLTQEVVDQIRETVTQAPEKIERISEIVNEELRGMRKRLEIFPEKSKKIEPKFQKFESLIERGVIPYTIWNFQYRDDYAGDKDFHGNCSPQIVEQCIWRLTEENDLVVDPMVGSGTTLDVCKRFNRRCIGYDIKPPENRPDVIQNDSRKIPLESNSVDMIFIHPPYWNLAYFTKAEENLPDLSRAKNVDEFIDMLAQVFKECYRILKPEKFMCVLLGDLIREGKFVPLCRKTANMAEKTKFVDYGYAVKLAHGEVSRKKSGVIIAEPVYTDNLKVSHDLVMFFKKVENVETR